MRDMMDNEFVKELCTLLNRKGIDNELSTPDYVLTSFLCTILDNYKLLITERKKHELKVDHVLPTFHRTV